MTITRRNLFGWLAAVPFVGGFIPAASGASEYEISDGLQWLSFDYSDVTPGKLRAGFTFISADEARKGKLVLLRVPEDEPKRDWGRYKELSGKEYMNLLVRDELNSALWFWDKYGRR